ncbi:MAG: BLUF domain-containing protein [Acidobacteriota bacterium]|jgi:hypothetical protein
MMKRIKYASRYSKSLTEEELENLGNQAAEKNAELGVTGVLMASGGMFYQVIEGPAECVDGLFAAIEEDERHTDVLVLDVDERVETRLFPDWSMKTVNLDAASHVRLMPLKVLMQAAYDQRQLVDKMTWAIERSLKHELGSSV